MKLLSHLTLVVLAVLLPLLDAQFPFAPSPPRAFFGGFRPFFPNRGRRPPRQPPSFAFNRPTRQQDFLSAPPTFRPPPPLPTQSNFRRPFNTRTPRFQQQPIVQASDFNGFGAPKPKSIIEPTNNFISGPPVRQPQTQFRRPVPFNNNNQFVRQPVSFLSDNSIIGMVPPPPLFSNPSPPPQQHQQRPPQPQRPFQPQPQRPPQPQPQRPPQPQPQTVPQRPSAPTLRSQIHHAQPVFEQFQTPTGPEIGPQNVPLEELQFNTSPRRPATSQVPLSKPVDPSDLQFNPFDAFNSNSIDDLVVNKVPPVNAGVLPLAHEKPSQLELFPPFTRRG